MKAKAKHWNEGEGEVKELAESIQAVLQRQREQFSKLFAALTDW